MDVAYIVANATYSMADSLECNVIQHRRTIKIGIGCACVQRQINTVEEFVRMLVEK